MWAWSEGFDVPSSPATPLLSYPGIPKTPGAGLAPAGSLRDESALSFRSGSIPPQVTNSRLLQWLKGKTAHHLLAEFPHLKKQFWGRHLWARGYFCCSSGNVTEEMVAEYIANQNVNEGQDEDFQVDG